MIKIFNKLTILLLKFQTKMLIRSFANGKIGEKEFNEKLELYDAAAVKLDNMQKFLERKI